MISAVNESLKARFRNFSLQYS